jgi:hypothetical protein
MNGQMIKRAAPVGSKACIYPLFQGVFACDAEFLRMTAHLDHAKRLRVEF